MRARQIESHEPITLLPKPIVKKSRWPGYLIALVPLCALVAVGFYAKAYLDERGPLITIRFKDADRIKVGDTPLLHRGVQIGQVADTELSPDLREVLVKVRLKRHEEAFARSGAAFWVVRPEISGIGLTGLNTVISGPYIDSTPGSGKKTTEFEGLKEMPQPTGDGVRLVLHASHLEHLQAQAPVYYRGIEVGVVHDIRLSREADGVDFTVVVWRRYSRLVKTGSRFWEVNGFDVKGGLFSGIHLKLDSLRTLVTGGVAFATPEKDMGAPVKDGNEFALEEEPKQEWLQWAPKIPIVPASSKTEERRIPPPS